MEEAKAFDGSWKEDVSPPQMLLSWSEHQGWSRRRWVEDWQRLLWGSVGCGGGGGAALDSDKGQEAWEELTGPGGSVALITLLVQPLRVPAALIRHLVKASRAL